jgi:uncharacterized protein
MNSLRSWHCVVRASRAGFLFGILFLGSSALAQEGAATDKKVGETIEVGKTGFAIKKPVFASACPHACPWGELGEFVQEAMRRYGYDVVLCRNCNRTEGPRIVAGAKLPPQLTPLDLAVGTNVRVNAPVDFGVTESGFLAWAYNGRYTYAKDGPYKNLRLIARIDDPTYLLAAVKKDSKITDLAQIKKERLPVRILATVSPTTQPLLDYYGLSKEAVESWGGTFANAMLARTEENFDLIISDLASPANNPESSYWTRLSQKFDLRFLDFSEELLAKLAGEKELGLLRVSAKWGLLRGVDRTIPTVGRSGEAIFGRADTPDQAAYDAAKAIDEHRGALQWYARPYSYNSGTVWKNFDVPLHPGAERYYREKGYMK